MSLDEPTEQSTRLHFGAFGDHRFDFRGADTHFLKRILDVASSRKVAFRNLTMSAGQSVVLVSRPHAVQLEFDGCVFTDGGTAFVDALENRESSLGSLTFEGNPGFTEAILKRFLQVDVIDELRFVGSNDQLTLLPFSAKVDHLEYSISASALNVDPESLNIVPKKLFLRLSLQSIPFPKETMLSFLRRVARLGHFVELKLGFYYISAIPDCDISELILATLANSNLRVLDLTNIVYGLNWNPHVGPILEGLKDHKELRELKLTADDYAFGPGYSSLRQFLSHNRNGESSFRRDID